MRACIYDRYSDFCEWADIFNPIRTHKFNSNYDKLLEDLQNQIIKSKKSHLAFYFAYFFNYKSYKMQNLILENNNHYYAYMFAQEIKYANIELLQNIVEKSNDVETICRFACFIKGSSVSNIEDIVLKSKKAKYAYNLIKYKKGSAEKLKNIIFKSKKPTYLFELSKHLKCKEDIDLIEDLILKSKSFTYIRLFAQRHKNCNLEKIEDFVMENGKPKDIKQFAMYVKRSKLKNLSILF